MCFLCVGCYVIDTEGPVFIHHSRNDSLKEVAVFHLNETKSDGGTYLIPMLRKLSHIVFSLIFLYGGVISAAPTILCGIVEKTDLPSCCPKKQEQKMSHCESEEDTCPACAQRFCEQDSSLAKLANDNQSSTSLVVIAVLPAFSFVSTKQFSHFLIPTNRDINTGPPRYLVDCTFRI